MNVLGKDAGRRIQDADGKCTEEGGKPLKAPLRAHFLRGRMVFRHGRMILPHGRTVFRYGKFIPPHGRLILQRGKMNLPHGRTFLPHGKMTERVRLNDSTAPGKDSAAWQNASAVR